VLLPQQERLKELSLDPEQFLASLPAPVAARVEELKKLQGKHDDLEEQYKKERAALEAKYQGLYGEDQQPAAAEQLQVLSTARRLLAIQSTLTVHLNSILSSLTPSRTVVFQPYLPVPNGPVLTPSPSPRVNLSSPCLQSRCTRTVPPL
jgi:hypothetical protein